MGFMSDFLLRFFFYVFFGVLGVGLFCGFLWIVINIGKLLLLLGFTEFLATWVVFNIILGTGIFAFYQTRRGRGPF